MRRFCQHAWLCTWSLGCLAEPARLEPPEAAIALTASDAHGHDVRLGELPRKPRLQLTTRVPLEPRSEAPWLFLGTPDAALLSDLERPPLTAASRARLVPTRKLLRGHTVVIEPLEVLSRAADYTLALPLSAHMAHTSAEGEGRAWTAQLHVEDSDTAGAAFTRSFPAQESVEVPTQLRFALIAYDGQVEGSAAGVWLEDSAGLAVAAELEQVDCAEYDSASVSCIRLSPEVELLAGARYSLRSGQALRDARGAELDELRAAFTTASSGPAVAQLVPAACALDERPLPGGCALASDDSIHLRLFAPAMTRVSAELAGIHLAQLPGAMSPLRFSALRPDTDYTLLLRFIDPALLVSEHQEQLRTAPPLPTLTISEVYADPAGAEPDQEFVELWNYGDSPASLLGLRLSDDAAEEGVPLDSALTLAPGARALIVGRDYDTHGAQDPTPALGVPLVRLAKTITPSGLANRGEPLFLRDASGRRLSAVPAAPVPREGRCVVRTSSDPRSAAPGSFEYAGDGCTPGY